MQRVDKGGSSDACRARGCGGYLAGVGKWIGDGEEAYCARCGRGHTFHVAGDGDDAIVYVEVHRKPRPTTGKVRGRGGAGGWVRP